MLKWNSCMIRFAEEVSRYTIYHATGNFRFPVRILFILFGIIDKSSVTHNPSDGLVTNLVKLCIFLSMKHVTEMISH